VKGVGEISSIPTTPAITNAIHNAVSVRVFTLWVDQDKLLRAMQSRAKEICKRVLYKPSVFFISLNCSLVISPLA
jgi:hypothetical protein